MSAIPNLPESVVRLKGAHPDANEQHVAELKRNIQHVEYANGPQVNGVQMNGGHEEKNEAQWQLHDTPIENQRPIRVIVVGAGYSGVYCGIRIPERLRNCELVIYEKNAGIGGTW